MKYCMSVVLLLLLAACSSNQEATRQEHELSSHTSSALKHSGLSVPLAIKTEHEHLHHELEAAVASGGMTGTRAREVAAILLPHFEEEEAYAMPPLGLLKSMARKEVLDETQVQAAIGMADRLRREYGKMIKEHEVMTEALRQLAAAARDERKPEQAAFAESLILHAQNEEQVLYPATLVIGDYLKLQRASRRNEQWRHQSS
jgi:hypothetical protein